MRGNWYGDCLPRISLSPPVFILRIDPLFSRLFQLYPLGGSIYFIFSILLQFQQPGQNALSIEDQG